MKKKRNHQKIKIEIKKKKNGTDHMGSTCPPLETYNSAKKGTLADPQKQVLLLM